MGGGDHPGGAAQVQRLAAGTPQGRREQGRRLEPAGQAPIGVVAAGVVAAMLVVAVIVLVGGGVAGDQHPGHRPITGQPPAGLRPQRLPPTQRAAQAGLVVEEAVQVHRHQQLRPHPTTLRQPAALQLAAGQLGQGVGGAGQWFQRRQDRVAGLWLQQPIHRHHALQGGRQPQPPSLMAAVGLALGGVGVGHPAEVVDRPAQLGWVEAAGGLQHRFGLGGGLRGEVGGGVGQHPGMRRGDLTVGQGLAGAGQGAAEQRSRGPHQAVRGPSAHPESGAEPGRGGADPDALLGAGGPAGVDGGQEAEEFAF